MRVQTLPWRAKRFNGFTLVELVVVVLVLGIIAAVAAPKMFDTTGDARQNVTKQSHAVVREAIDMHLTRTGAYPGDSGTAEDLKADLKPYLRGEFPRNQLVDAAGDASVTVTTDGAPLVVGGVSDWKYDNKTGEFIVNTAGFDAP